MRSSMRKTCVLRIDNKVLHTSVFFTPYQKYPIIITHKSLKISLKISGRSTLTLLYVLNFLFCTFIFNY